MKLIVLLLTGDRSTIDVADDAKLEDVKAVIEKELSIPAAQQRPILHGKQLEDGPTLVEQGVVEDSTIQMVVAVPQQPQEEG